MYENETFTKAERKFLKYVASHEPVKESDVDRNIYNRMYKLRLIHDNFTGDQDSFGAFIRDGTFSIERSNYERYQIEMRDRFVTHKLPAIFSGISLIVAICALIASIISVYFTYINMQSQLDTSVQSQEVQRSEEGSQ